MQVIISIKMTMGYFYLFFSVWSVAQGPLSRQWGQYKVEMAK